MTVTRLPIHDGLPQKLRIARNLAGLLESEGELVAVITALAQTWGEDMDNCRHLHRIVLSGTVRVTIEGRDGECVSYEAKT